MILSEQPLNYEQVSGSVDGQYAKIQRSVEKYSKLQPISLQYKFDDSYINYLRFKGSPLHIKFVQYSSVLGISDQEQEYYLFKSFQNPSLFQQITQQLVSVQKLQDLLHTTKLNYIKNSHLLGVLLQQSNQENILVHFYLLVQQSIELICIISRLNYLLQTKLKIKDVIKPFLNEEVLVSLCSSIDIPIGSVQIPLTETDYLLVQSSFRLKQPNSIGVRPSLFQQIESYRKIKLIEAKLNVDLQVRKQAKEYLTMHQDLEDEADGLESLIVAPFKLALLQLPGPDYDIVDETFRFFILQPADQYQDSEFRNQDFDTDQLRQVIDQPARNMVRSHYAPRNKRDICDQIHESQLLFAQEVKMEQASLNKYFQLRKQQQQQVLIAANTNSFEIDQQLLNLASQTYSEKAGPQTNFQNVPTTKTLPECLITVGQEKVHSQQEILQQQSPNLDQQPEQSTNDFDASVTVSQHCETTAELQANVAQVAQKQAPELEPNVASSPLLTLEPGDLVLNQRIPPSQQSEQLLFQDRRNVVKSPRNGSQSSVFGKASPLRSVTDESRTMDPRRSIPPNERSPAKQLSRLSRVKSVRIPTSAAVSRLIEDSLATYQISKIEANSDAILDEIDQANLTSLLKLRQAENAAQLCGKILAEVKWQIARKIQPGQNSKIIAFQDHNFLTEKQHQSDIPVRWDRRRLNINNNKEARLEIAKQSAQKVEKPEIFSIISNQNEAADIQQQIDVDEEQVYAEFLAKGRGGNDSELPNKFGDLQQKACESDQLQAEQPQQEQQEQSDQGYIDEEAPGIELGNIEEVVENEVNTSQFSNYI